MHNLKFNSLYLILALIKKTNNLYIFSSETITKIYSKDFEHPNFVFFKHYGCSYIKIFNNIYFIPKSIGKLSKFSLKLANLNTIII